MNKIFKVIWSKSKQCYIVVSEIAKNKTGKKKIVVASILAALAVTTTIQDVSAVTGNGNTNKFSDASSGVAYQSGQGLAIGTNATVASGNTNTVAIGVSSVAYGSSSFATSGGSTAPGKDGQVAIGWSSTNGIGAVAIGGTSDTASGRDTRATGTSAVALGVGSAANGSNAFVASGGSATGNNAIAISGGTANGNGSIAIGWQTNAKNDATAVGSNAQATDKDSVAVGKNSNAAGESATAVGSSATASGRGGVAVGWNAESAVNAVGVGFNAKAKANNTVAIGVEANNDKVNAISNNYSSVSVGVATRARAVGSMAMGVSADASGNYSIALGSGDVRGDFTDNANYPKATGEKAIAIGYNSNSSNTAATAIGAGATASGQDSFAGGSGTAGGNSSIAIGKSSGATNDRALAVGVNAKATGKDTVAVGSGAGGTVGLGFASSIDDNKGVVQTIKNINVATTADGDNAVAVGHYANAMNSGVALGQNTLAATGGVAIGKGVFEDTNNVDAGGTVIGQDSTVTGFYSLAVGRYTFASGSTSMAMGYDASAKGNYAVAMGRKVIADGTSTAIGHHAVATNGGLAIGSQDNDASKDKTTASASGAVAIGKNTQSTLKGAVALGSDSTTATNATKQESVTINGITYNFAGATSDTGMQVSVGTAGKERQIKNVAAGEVSATSTDAINGSQLFAVASQIKPIQYFAVNSSVAGNKDNSGATGSDSVAIGPNAKAQAVSSIALGNNATAAGGNSIAIGNTSSATDKQSPISIGYGATANGDFSIAIGGGDNNTNYGATANGVGGTSLGGKTKTTGGNFQTAVGFGATTTAQNASAFGYNATTSVEGGVALGFNSSSRTGVNKGYNPNDNRTNKYNDLNGNVLTSTTGAIAVGNGSTVTRQITGVAAGTKDTDAVNVAQLKSVNLAFKGNVGSGDVNLATNDSDKKLTIQGDRTYITTNASGNTLTISANKKDINVTNGTARADAGVADAKNVAEAINNAVSQNKYKWYLTADNDTGGSRATIDKEGTVKFSGDSNITVSRNGNTITTSLNKAITVDSVKANKTITVGTNKITLDGNTGAVTGKAFNGDSFTAGNNVLSNTTLQIGSPTGGNNVSITRDGLTAKAGTKTVKFGTNGIDAGDQQITHVSSGGNVGTNAANITDVKNAVSDVTLKLDTNAKTGNVKLSEGPLKVIGANGIRTDLVGTNNGSLVVGLDSNTVNATTKGIGLTGDTGSTGLKYLKDGDASFKVAGDGNLVTTKASATGVQVAVDTAKVKDLAVEAVTVSKATNIPDNPITVTPKAGTNSKEYAIGIDTTKLAAKTHLAYTANGGTAKTVSLAKGLNFVNGTNTVATVDSDGKVSFDINKDTKDSINKSATAVGRTITLNADSGTGSSQSLSNGNVSFAVSGATGDYISTTMDGSAVKVSTKRATINSDANTGAASVTGADGLATAKNVASAINSAVNGLSQNLNISDGTNNSSVALKNQKLTVTGTGAAKATVNGQTITIDVAKGTLTANANGTATGTAGVADASDVASAINNTNTVLGNKITKNAQDIATNTSNITANKNQITTNTTNIATNTANIAHTIALADDASVSTTAKSLKDGNVSFNIKGDNNFISTAASGNDVTLTVNEQAIKDAAKNASSFKVKANATAAEDVKGGDTITFNNGDNIEISQTGKTFTIKTAKNITVDSVTAGNTVINTSGLTNGTTAITGTGITTDKVTVGGISIDKTAGINAGGKVISNVASGTVNDNATDDSNAANIGDVKQAVANLSQNLGITDGTNNGTVDLKNQKLNVAGANGVTATVNNQTITVGLDANTVNATTKGIGLTADTGSTGNKYLKDGDVSFAVTGDGNLVSTSATAAGVKVAVDAAKVKALAVASVTVSKDTQADNPITVTPTAGTNSKDYAIGIDTTKLAAKTDLTYRANSATDANAKKVSLSKGLNFVDGGSTVATVDNDGKVSFDLNTATKDQINTNTADIATNKGKIATNTTNIAANTTALARNISLGADTGTASSQSLSTADVAFNVKGVTGDFVSTNMNGNTVEISTKRATINSNATTGEASVTGNDGLATAQNVADAINKAADAAKAGAAWNVTTNSSTTDKTAVKGGDTVDLVNGDNIEITQDGTDKKKITVATKKDITVDSVTANNKVTVGSGANKITLDGTDGSVTGKAFTGTTFTGTSFTGISLTAGNTVINTNGLTNGTTTITGTGVTTDNVTVGGISIDKTTGINAGNKVISNVASGGTTATNAANIGDVQNAVANLSQNLNITDGTNNGTVDLKNQKLNVAGANGVTATVKDQTITVGLDANTVNATTKGIGLTADTGSTGNKYLKDGDVSFAVTGDGSLVSTSATAAGVKVAVKSASITAGADGTITGPTTDGVATAKNVADAINAAKKASKTDITANTGEAANATTGNVTLTSTTAADGHTIYDVKINDKVTLGTGANAVTIDGTTGAITGKTATIGGVTVNGTANTIGGLSNTTWNGTAVSGRAATEDQLKAATGATTLKFTGDVATNTGSVNLKDDTFGIKGDGKYISTDVNGKNVNLTISEAEVKKSAVAAVTVSTDTTDANNPLTVTPTTSADGTTKDYKVTIDGTKIANKTNLSYKANDGTPKQVSLADGLNFKNGTLTTASIDDNGVVKYDVNTASITAGADGTITGPTTDGVATAKNVADAINAAKKASKTEITANTGEAANATTGNVTLTSTTAADGHTIYDVKLNDKVTLGTGANAVTVDGTAAKVTAGVTTVDGATGTITTGGTNSIKVDGATGTVTGLTNKDWTPGVTKAVTGRAATEDQLQKVADAASSQTWNITADKAGTTGSQTGTKKNATVGKDETVELVAGDNLTINQNERKFTYSLNKDLANLTSVSVGTGTTETIKLDGATGKITAKNAVIGGVTVDGDNNHVTGLANTTWNGTATTGRAATEDQLKAVAETAKTTTDAVNLKFTGDTNTSPGVVNLKDDTLGIVGDGKYVSTDANGKNLTVKVSEAEVKKSAVAAVTVSTDTTDANNPLTVTPTTSADGTTKDYKVTIDGTKIANKTNLSYRANDGTPKQVSLADGLNFKNGTLTTASIDDAGVVKYDVNTAAITAGTDGTITGPTTDGVATAQNVADAINAAKKASKTEVTANTGEAANATTGNVTLTSTTAADGHTIYDVKLNDKVTLGSGANAVTIDGTAGKATIGSSVINGVNNTFTTGGAKAVTLDGATGTITGTTANIGGVTVNGTANTLGGLSNTTWNGTATTGRAATEDQLKAVADAAGSQTWEITADKKSGTSGAQTGIKENAKVGKDDKVSLIAGENLTVDQVGKNFTYSLNTDLVKMNSATFEATGGKTTVIKGDSIVQTDGANVNTSNATSNTITDGTNTSTITAGKAQIGTVGIDGVVSKISTGGTNAVVVNGADGTIKTGNVTVTGGTTNDITGLSNTTVTAADFATKGRAATEEQLKAATGATTLKFTGDVATNTGSVNLKDDTFGIKGDGKYISTDVNGKNVNLTISEAEVKKSAVAAVTVSTDTTDANNPLTVTPTTSADGTTKDYKVTIDGTKIANKTNLSYKANDGTAKQVSLADGLNFKNGTLTTASIDDNGVVKYDVNTASITAGADGTITGPTTDGVATAQNVADAINAAKKASKTEITANTGEAANATTGNVTLTSTTAADGHTIYDVKLNDKVTLGSGANAVTIDGTAGKATIGSSIVDGVNSTFTTGGANAVKLDGAAGTIKTGTVTVTGGTTNDITGLSNTTVTSADFATKGRAATEEQLKAVGEQTWQITADKDATTSGAQTGTKKDAKVGKNDKVQLIAGENMTVNQNERDFTFTLNKDLVKMNSATFEATGGKTTVIKGDSIVQTDGTKTNTATASGNTVANGTKSTETTAAGQVIKDGAKSNKSTVDNNVIDDGNGNVNTSNATSNTITDGTNTSAITAGKATIGSSVIDGVNNTFTTGGANAVKLDGAAGTIKTGTVTVTGGTTNDITGLSNTTVTSADFATKGRAATEEQLKAVGEQTWQITADKDATTSGAQTGTKKNAKVGKDDKVQLIAGENLTVNQNERDFTFTLNKDLVKLNSATFLGTGSNTTVITGNSITQTAGTQTNTSTAGGNTVADGTKSTETTAAGQVIKDGAKSNKSTVDSNVIDDGNGNVNTSNATSNTVTDGTNTTATTSSSVTVKDNAGNSTVITKDNVTTGVGANKVTLDGTAGKATIGSSVIDGVNNTFTTGGANAVKLDGAAGTIKTGTVTVTGGTTNDITGLSNTTVTAADFATKGRAATEEQLKAVGEQTWQITADKDATTSGAQTGTKKDAKVGKDDKVQLIAGENMTVNQNERDFTFTLNKDLVKMNSATFEATGGKTTVIKGDSIVQTDGTKTNTATASGNTVANGTKSTETTAAGQVIKDGAKSNKSTVDNNVIDDGNGNVNTSNATSNTITDGTNTSTITAGKATIGSSVIDGVNNTFTTGGANAVKLDGVAGTIKTGTVTVTGGTTNDITGLSNTTVTSADFATKGRAATEEQLKAVGEQTWQITADKDATTSGAQTGTKKNAKVGKDDKVQLIAGENLTVNQNERDFTYSLNKDLVKMNSATFEATGGRTTVIKGDSIVQTDGTKVNTSTAGGSTVADGTKSTETTADGQVIKDGAKSNKSTVDSNVIDDGNGNVNTSNATSNTITDGTNTSTVTAGKAQIGTVGIDGVASKITTGGANAVVINGADGTVKTGTVTVIGGTTNDITGLSNTTVTAADFATKGRAATEEQLKAVGEQTWQITADKDATTSGVQTGTKKDAKVGKDDKVQLIAGENLTVNQNERDFTYSLNKDLVKMNSATFEATGGKTTVIKGDSIVQTDGTKVNTSTAAGNTVVDGAKSTATTADGTTVTTANGNTNYAADGVRINTTGKTPVSLTDAGLDNGNNVIKNVASGHVNNDATDNTNAANIADVKKATTTVTANAGEAANATTGNVTLTSTTAADGHTIYDVKLNDKVTLGSGANAVTIDGTAGKATFGSSVVDGVNNTFTTGGANAVKLDGAAGTIKTGTVTVTGGTTNDITGLSNTTVTAADFATKGRAATEEQLKAVGEQTWQITADKDATTSGAQTGTKKDAKVGKDDKVQLIAGENMTVNQNERDFTFTLNKDLVKMNSATFLGTGSNTTVITGNSITQTAGTQTNTSTAGGNTVADGTKSTETTAAGQVIKDGAKSNKSTVDSNVIDDGTGNVNTSNATSNTVTDGTNTTATTSSSVTVKDNAGNSTVITKDNITTGVGGNKITLDGTAGKATVGSSVVDGVNNTFTTGGTNAVKLDGAAGTIKTGTVTVTGGTTNDITGLSNTTVTAADFATKGRAATEEQLKAVGEQTWQITADKDATTSGAQTGTKKDAKVGKDDKVQLIAGENMTVNQNERDFTFTLNKDLVKMNSATFLGTGSNTTVITGNSITQTAGTQTNTSTAAGNTIANGTKSTETTADGQVIKDGAKSNKSTVDSNVIDDGNGNVNTSNATSNTITDGTNTSTITAGKANIGNIAVDGVNNKITMGNGATPVTLDGANGHLDGLTNTTWVPGVTKATTGRAATEDQLQQVSDAVGAGWKVNTGTVAGSSGVSNGAASTKVSSGEEVKLQAGDNLVIDQNGKTVSYSLNKDLTKMNSATFEATGGKTTVIKGDSIVQTDGGKTNTSNAAGNTVVDGNKSTATTAAGITITDGAKTNTSTADKNVINDGAGNTNVSNATSNTLKNAAGDETKSDAKGVIVKDAAGNNATFTKDGITITKTGKDTVSLTSNGLDNGKNKIVNVAAGVANTDAVNVGQLKEYAAKSTTELTANNGETAGSTKGNIVLTKTTAADGHTIYDNKLNDKITLGTDPTKAVTVDGTTGMVTGLTNKTWTPGSIVSGRAATEDQLKDAVADSGWKAAVDKEGSGQSTVVGTSPEKIKAEETVTFKAGNNMMVTQTGKSISYAVNPELTDMKSATFKDAAGNTTVTNGNGITITPGSANPTNPHAGPVSLTKDGLNNGNNQIKGVAPGTDPTDAVNVSQLNTSNANTSQAINQIAGEVQHVGAHAAAMAALKPIQYDPLEPTQVMAGVGNYRGETAAALGLAHYTNENTMFNVGVSVGGNHNMVNAGVTHKFGYSPEKKNIPDRYKAGPISSVYVMQDEVSSLKKENAEQKYVIADQAARLTTLEAENEQQRRELAETKKGLDDLKAAVDKLLASKG